MISSCNGGAICLANAALSGLVSDEEGRPLPNATISVHKLSGEHFDASAKTDSGGRYSFPELPDGNYALEASLSAFVTVEYRPVRIYFPAQVRWDLVLRFGGFDGGDAVYANSELVGELMWKGARVPLDMRTAGEYRNKFTLPDTKK